MEYSDNENDDEAYDEAYEQALKKLHDTRAIGKKDELNGIRILLEKLGEPQKDLKFVHVLGTNGKGSISSMIASVMICGGVRTGLYISPFVDDFRERIQVNKEAISKKDFAVYFAQVQEAIEKMLKEGYTHPTEFELLTATAMLHYKKEQCELVVLEAGIGGRIDATNVIPSPEVTVLASISLDHTDMLGENIRQIAAEKCGAIKEKTTVVTCPGQSSEALDVIRHYCLKKQVTLIAPMMPNKETYKCTPTGSHLIYEGLTLEIPLPGKYQIQNTITALEALRVLAVPVKKEFQLTNAAMEEGIAITQFHGRLEWISKTPAILVDGSHNPQGIDALAAFLDECLEDKKKIIILGMMKDKNYSECIPKIAAHADILIPVEIDSFRALKTSEISAIAEEYCSEILPAISLKNAIEIALYEQHDIPQSLILITGSLYLPGEAKRIIKPKLSNLKGVPVQ